MSNLIKVRLIGNDQFEVLDPDTGNIKRFSSILIHEPQFIVDESVKRFFCEAFPGKTEWDCSIDALERIRGIVDYNVNVSDELRW